MQSRKEKSLRKGALFKPHTLYMVLSAPFCCQPGSEFVPRGQRGAQLLSQVSMEQGNVAVEARLKAL